MARNVSSEVTWSRNMGCLVSLQGVSRNPGNLAPRARPGQALAGPADGSEARRGTQPPSELDGLTCGEGGGFGDEHFHSQRELARVAGTERADLEDATGHHLASYVVHVDEHRELTGRVIVAMEAGAVA